MATDVDVVVLTRDEQPIDDGVLAAIHSQEDVNVRLHRVIGTPRDDDANRWETIARARNVGARLGSSAWLMYVDDDVVLGQNCISQLLQDLKARSSYVAMAADYLNQRDSQGVSLHVAMGATLFRRDAMERIEFRWEQNRCECQCMCDDLRRNHLGIDYSESASAFHLPGAEKDAGRHTTLDDSATSSERSSADEPSADLVKPAEADVQPVVIEPSPLMRDEDTGSQHQQAEILVAFDRSHMGLFRGQFIVRLRESGNDNTVHAVTYGLRDKQLKTLRRIPGVKVHSQPYTVQRVCRSRLLGFQIALRDLCPKTPVAYWDAGDVLFQASLEPLWAQVRQHPGKLLVVEEPLSLAANPGHQIWIQSINNPIVRRRTISLLRDRPVINGGFIAGAAGCLLRYFEAAYDLINGDLLGAGGGDQVVLNVYRYSHPTEFVVVDDTWNYCLVGRSGRHCKVRKGKYLDVLRGRAVSVVHGNAGTLV